MWAPEYTVGAPAQRRLNYFVPSARQGGADQVESGRTYQSPGRGPCVHAVEFSKTDAPCEGDSPDLRCLLGAPSGQWMIAPWGWPWENPGLPARDAASTAATGRVAGPSPPA